MNERMLSGLREAMSVLHRDGPLAATDKIQQTLRGLMPEGTWTGDTRPQGQPEPLVKAAGVLPDLLARLGIEVPLGRTPDTRPSAPRAAPKDAEDAPAAGKFLAGSFTNQAGTRAYKLYVPTAWQSQPLPLVVMLHGGGQTPDDCAAGTRFNRLAEAGPCLVLYPAQAPTMNATRCWNWFDPLNQQRDQGEPAIIAGMTQEVIDSYNVDPARVYCTGMSAGGAMAVILGATYPDLYAAVGAHSAMPYAAASDFSSAFTAMSGAAAPAATKRLQGVPVIVFHGDRDETVHPRNGDQIMTQALPSAATELVREGQAGAGHPYTQRVHTGADGRVVAEQWLVHGAGHAWSGGSRSGSYTDAQGPDASREMLRFFAAHRQRAVEA